jgi:carbon monoxide dehydrogenase subunit G
MRFSGEITVKARRDAVFASISDANVFASLIDGVSDFVPIDEKRFAAVLETKVAYMSFRFKVTVEFTQITPPHEIAAKIEGTPLGLVGRLTATTMTRLLEAGATGEETRIQYEIDTALTGKLGSIGQPVMKAKARDMEKLFAKNLQARFDQVAHVTRDMA